MLDRVDLIQIQTDKLKTTNSGYFNKTECKKNVFNIMAMMNTALQIVINFSFIMSNSETFRIQSSYALLNTWLGNVHRNSRY